MEITLPAPYCLAPLPPARCKDGFRAHSSPTARLRGRTPRSLPFSRVGPARPDSHSGQGVAGGRRWPGLGQSFVPVPLGWLAGTDGAHQSDRSGQSKPGPHRTGAGPGRCAAAGRAGKRGGAAGRGLEGVALGRGRRCHSRRRGARSSLQPRSPVSQSPFQPLCGLLTGGGWSYIKAHYENYNIGPRACPRRQLGSFQALSPCSAGLSCKISI